VVRLRELAVGATIARVTQYLRSLTEEHEQITGEYEATESSLR